MKKYNNNIIEEAYCNKCGKKFNVANGIIMEGSISIKEKWGYFSKKDLEQHAFELCEECYDKIIAEFHIPVTIKEYITVEEKID